jgi:hypothetical protein
VRVQELWNQNVFARQHRKDVVRKSSSGRKVLRRAWHFEEVIVTRRLPGFVFFVIRNERLVTYGAMERRIYFSTAPPLGSQEFPGAEVDLAKST